MSLGIHRKHFLSAADRVRIQKAIEQEERYTDDMVLLYRNNPFNKKGVLWTAAYDSAGASNDSANALNFVNMLKAVSPTEFNFSDNDDFTFEVWLYWENQTEFGIYFDDYLSQGFDYEDIGFSSDGSISGTSAYDQEPQYGNNGYHMYIGNNYNNEQMRFSSKSANGDYNAIVHWDNVGDLTGSPDSVGGDDEMLQNDRWHHIVWQHTAGSGMSLFIDGIPLVTDVPITIKKCVRANRLHITGGRQEYTDLVIRNTKLNDSAGAAEQPWPANGSAADKGRTYFGTIQEDFLQYELNDLVLGPLRVSRTARYSTSGFSLPTTEPDSDDDTVLLLLFRYNGDDEILDIVDTTAITPRSRKTLTIQNTVDWTKGDSAGYPYSPERTIRVSEIATTPLTQPAVFEPDSAGIDLNDDPTTAATIQVFVSTNMIESGDWQSLAPYMTITGDTIEDFNFTHNDPWTFDWMYPFPFSTSNTQQDSNYRGFMMSDPDTHNGWGFSFNEFEFHWWSNDPTNSHLQVFYWNTGKDSAGDHWAQGRFDPDPSVGFPDTFRMRHSEHIAIVNVPGEGVSLYAYMGDSEGQGHRVAGPFPIHITANTTTSTVYWGGIEKLTSLSTTVFDSAGNTDVWSSAGSEPNNLPSTYYLRDSTNSIGEDVGWGTRHARNSTAIYEVRVSNIARYTGDTYNHPNVDAGHYFVNDENTIFLCHPIATRLDSGGDYQAGNTYKNGQVVQDSGIILGGDDNGEDI